MRRRRAATGDRPLRRALQPCLQSTEHFLNKVTILHLKQGNRWELVWIGRYLPEATDQAVAIQMEIWGFC